MQLVFFVVNMKCEFSWFRVSSLTVLRTPVSAIATEDHATNRDAHYPSKTIDTFLWAKSGKRRLGSFNTASCVDTDGHVAALVVPGIRRSQQHPDPVPSYELFTP